MKKKKKKNNSTWYRILKNKSRKDDQDEKETGKDYWIVRRIETVVLIDVGTWR